jgi:uncharacterized damage-inducible protein DinB
MKTLLKTILDYNSWANQQVWNCVQSLSDEQFNQAHAYSVGSVYEQIFHLMSTDFWTLTMLDGSDSSNAPKKEDFTTRDAIWTRWQEIDTAYHTWLDKATDDDLNREIGFPETNELTVTGSCAEYLVIIENHTTNHRAQILALIHQLGGETCEMGMYYFICERAMKH